jgi:Cu(I)/Ag(I) efflux system membrane protein CusA/SilA
VVGGIVVMRYGENADKVIDAVKLKMKEVEKELPEG